MIKLGNEKQVKALILAAGLGSRLMPITAETPKCLVKVGQNTMLERWIKNLESCNCSEAIINTHHLSKLVENQVEEYRKYYKTDLICSYEQILLGTAGTLMKHIEYFRNSMGVLLHADNATDFDLKELIQEHNKRPKECILTMLTFDTEQPEACGIVTTDENGIVREYVEKPKKSNSKKANAAVFVFEDEFIEWFKENGEKENDFSKDILPLLTGKIFACHTQKEYIDIGTPKNLAKAQEIWGETK